MSPSDELFVGFLAESSEALAGLDDRFVAMERGDPEAIAAIFRPVHSLKGNASFFGLAALKELAHELETVLDRIRSGRLRPSRRIGDVCLAALDGLRGMLARVAAGQPEVEDPAQHAGLLARLREGAAPWPRALELARRLRAEADPDGVAQADELLALLLQLAGPEAGSGTHPVEGAAGPDIASVRPARDLDDLFAAFRAGVAPAELGPRIAAALEALGAAALDAPAQAAWRQLSDAYRDIIAAIGIDQVAIDLLAEQLPKVLANGAWRSDATRSVAAAPAAAPAVPATVRVAEPGTATEPASERRERTGTESRGKALRVAEADVDEFLHRVGDLLVTGDALGHLVRRLAAGAPPAEVLPDARRVARDIAAAGDHLQAAVMRLRRVPLGPLLKKAPRIARDVAHARSKEIEVMIRGEDVAVDKARLDILDAALLHLVRNSADHGIEAPAARAAAGKPRQGVITVSAAVDAGEVILRIEDDGGGIDPARVRRKAEELGIVAAGQTMDERAIVDLVFASGVSTAEKVTDVSGRGVGLDAVKRAVEEAGGAITCDNRPGRGCAFTLRLPLAVSTQIKPAYLLSVSGRAFGLPLEAVGETFRVVDGEVSTVAGGGRCVMRHGRVLPVLELSSILASDRATSGAVLVTVSAVGGPLALAVDAALGVQQVVVRPIEGSATVPHWINGAALLGDGGVALLLDLPQLLAAMKGG